jgi:hypothetical protein
MDMDMDYTMLYRYIIWYYSISMVIKHQWHSLHRYPPVTRNGPVPNRSPGARTCSHGARDFSWHGMFGILPLVLDNHR